MRFRSFLRAPSQSQAFGSSLGAGMSDRPAEVRRLMSGLAQQLSAPYAWPTGDHDERPTWENPAIPSGYTYLAQLVAHDCVFTSVPTGALPPNGVPTSRRAAVLRLETVYGEGPDSCPHAYAQEGTNHVGRSRLAVDGPVMRDGAKGRYLFRDFGRATTRSACPAARSQAVHVADGRNDAHAALAQVTTLFLQLHNRLAAELEDVVPTDAFATEEIRRYRTYFVTRAACEQIYRRIVRVDLLPRLLHPVVVAAYAGQDVQFLDEQPLDALPLEFASTFRFGHAMVRHNYVFNDLNSYGEDLVDMMLSNSAARPWRMPLDHTWMAQWGRFFEIGGSRPNLSRRIGPELSGGLFSGEVFGAVDETGSVGLGYRDLLNGAFVGLWSVVALAAELRARRPALARLSPLLSDDAHRVAQLGAWLRRHRVSNGLGDADIDALAEDPPLFLYVLFEAAQEMNGERLGTLGSLILAETLYRALRDADAAMNGSLAIAGKVALGREVDLEPLGRRIHAIDSMPALVAFLAAGLEDEEQVRAFVGCPMHQGQAALAYA